MVRTNDGARKRSHQVINVDDDDDEEFIELDTIDDEEADSEVINVYHHQQEFEPSRKKIKFEEFDQEAMVSDGNTSGSPFYASNESSNVFCSDVVSKIMQYLPYFQTIRLMSVSSEWKQAQCGVTMAYIKETIKSTVLKKFIGSPCFKNLACLDVRANLKPKAWQWIFKACVNLTHLRIRHLNCTVLGPDVHNTNLSKLKTIVIDDCSFSPGKTADLKYAINNPYLYNLRVVSVNNIGRTVYKSLLSVKERLTELKLENISTKLGPFPSSFEIFSLTKLDLKFTTIPVAQISSIVTAIFSNSKFIQLTHLRLKASPSQVITLADTTTTIGKESNLVYLNIGGFGDAFLVQLFKMKMEKLQYLYIDRVDSPEVFQELDNNLTISGLKTLAIRHIHANCQEELVSIPEKFPQLEFLEINQCTYVDDIEHLLIYPYTHLKRLSLKWSIGKLINTDIGVGTAFENLDKLTLHIIPKTTIENYKTMSITMDSDFSNIKEIILNTPITSLARAMYSAPMNKVTRLDVTIYDAESAQALIQNTSFEKLRIIRVRYDPVVLESGSLDAIIRIFKNHNLKLYFYHNSK
ncbi:viral resistance protein [Naegleria gruberi]|uniref:Viral resistance protein n=1 Tax=Naegleria gruberi TaxID=5762 RepID=D2VBW9_NAEGR|nr:viral resistance protein [Naegleria gruberi]EFC45650.1 viral resistance protein [Naegleria gruberi]|eukprot:XP_002678394.1 viral resistance protein [Naegleria gruberi strain NEG-M]